MSEEHVDPWGIDEESRAADPALVSHNAPETIVNAACVSQMIDNDHAQSHLKTPDDAEYSVSAVPLSHEKRRECVTHHYACDCREALHAQQLAEAQCEIASVKRQCAMWKAESGVQLREKTEYLMQFETKDTLLAALARALQKGREMADTIERGVVFGVPQVQSVARTIVRDADKALAAYDQHTKGTK